MDLHFGAQVRDADGNRFGTLHRVVLDTETIEVVGLAVERAGFDDTEVLVPVGAVNSGDDEAVVVALNPNQFAELPPYSLSRNIAPPPDAAEVDQAQVDDPIDVPDVPPIGAATGIESIAFTPVLQEVTQLGPGQEAVDVDTVARATDGEVGRVRWVVMDEQTRRVAALIASHGGIFTRDVELPAAAIEGINEGTVTLRAPLAELLPRDD